MQLEVVILVQPVSGNGFRETQLDVVRHGKYAVGRLGLAKENRRSRVLRTTKHRRGFADEARTMATERDGSQVVVQFLGVGVPIEAEGCDATILYHRLVAGGKSVE